MKKRMFAFLIAAVLMLALPACQKAEEYPAMAADGEHPLLVAHAGGAIYGYRQTNSLEALNEGYENGFRFIELDMEQTTDGEVVLIHDWDSMAGRLLFSRRQYSLAEFAESETFQQLTLLDLAALLDWLEEHPAVTIITDVKAEDHLAVLETIRDTGAADRFIPQVYSYEEYDEAKALGYERVILTLYRMELDEQAVMDFAAEKHPWAITVSQERVTETLLTGLAASETAVYAHTVNNLSFYEQWSDRGLTGIYTDYFIPDQWPD